MEGQRVRTPAAVPDAELVQGLLDLVPAMVSVALRSVEVAAPSVTLPQFRALLVLQRVGPCNGTELAEHLGTHPSSVTRICDRLVHLGHATRAPRPENRRQVVLDVTSQGRTVVRRVERHREQELRLVLERLPAGVRAHLARGLPDLLAELQGGEAALPGDWAH